MATTTGSTQSTRVSHRERNASFTLKVNTIDDLTCLCCFDLMLNCMTICSSGHCICFNCLIHLRLQRTSEKLCSFCKTPLIISFPPPQLTHLLEKINSRVNSTPGKRKTIAKRRRGNRGTNAPVLNMQLQRIADSVHDRIREDRVLTGKVDTALQNFNSFEAFKEFIYILEHDEHISPIAEARADPKIMLVLLDSFATLAGTTATSKQTLIETMLLIRRLRMLGTTENTWLETARCVTRQRYAQAMSPLPASAVPVAASSAAVPGTATSAAVPVAASAVPVAASTVPDAAIAPAVPASAVPDAAIAPAVPASAVPVAAAQAALNNTSDAMELDRS